MTTTATYSPEDNKLRIYASHRFDTETYARLKAAGYSWAPKQQLFVAPMWTPSREDLAVELAGDLEDEDKTLVSRAEERAERFDEYSHKRANDAEQAKNQVKAISEHIPLGQPILIGHHSERHARRDAERIESGMRKAVKMWRTSQYWQDRAAGAISAAKYKERPDVRARRIKKIESELRKVLKNVESAKKFLKFWSAETIVFEKALTVANYLDHAYYDFNGRNISAWQILDEVKDGTDAEKIERVLFIAEKRKTQIPPYLEHCERWIEHYQNRLTYERAMLNESGGLETDKTRPERGGACKCWVGGDKWLEIQKVNRVTVSVLDNWGNGGRDFLRTVPFDKLREVMSAKQWQEHKAQGLGPGVRWTPRAYTPAPPTEYEQMAKSLRSGVAVQVVQADQLFPTPKDLAHQMAALLEADGKTVLEPSAGTGRLVDAVYSVSRPSLLVSVEIQPKLAQILNATCADFLSLSPEILGTFDRIIMNPPFHRGADIDHITHALRFLNPGGRLVALCANGPSQMKELSKIGKYEPLPDGSFTSEGTNVRVALLVVDKAPASVAAAA